ncbi:hypothetical protein HU200_002881 [Digitaria exilis]|uniref:Reverse transcriptase zinc-binding domain-containing protein n=1 Tax=Digitaria exilis TaxID=1010633 RepID=A0A835KYU3_9POAL|nr:hypothetical protein HU200_002881 [Digitaria exilis]
MKIKISVLGSEDWIVWNFEKTRIFSVRSAYRLGLQLETGPDNASSSSRPDGERSMWKKLWSAHIRRANKFHRHLDDHRTCELCRLEPENGFHVVVTCPHAKALREAMRDIWELPKEADLAHSGPDWLLLLLDRFDSQTCANFLMLLWRCWHVRNGVLMAGEKYID